MIGNGLNSSDFSSPSEVSSPLISIPENHAKDTKKAVRKTKAKEPSPVEGSPDPEDKKKSVSERRAEQNRQAQKSFRERKVRYVKELEDKLQIATEASLQADMLKLENTELRSLILSLQNENKRLKESNINSHANPSTNFTPQLKPEHLNFNTYNITQPTDNFVPSAATATTSISQNKPNFSAYETSNINIALNTDTNFSQTYGLPLYSPSLVYETNQIYDSLSSSTTSNSSSNLNVSQPMSSYFMQAPNGSFQFDTSFNNTTDFSTLVGPCDVLTLDPESFLQADPSLPISVDDWSGLLNDESNKRSVEEASLYLNTPLPSLPFIFQKDEDAVKVIEEIDLCDLLKKVQCKERNPELCKGTKFMKAL